MPSARILVAALAAVALAGCQRPEAQTYNPIDEGAVVPPTACTEVAASAEQVTCRVVATHVLGPVARQGGMKGRYQVMDYDVTMVLSAAQLAGRAGLVWEQPETTAKLTFRGSFAKPLPATITMRPSFELSTLGKDTTITHVHPGISDFKAELPGFVNRIIRDQMNVYEAWQLELATVANVAHAEAQKAEAKSAAARKAAEAKKQGLN